MYVLALGPFHVSLLRRVPMQIARPGGYEDCIATRGIEKSGPSDALRDAIAIMYSGTYTTHAVVNKFSRSV